MNDTFIINELETETFPFDKFIVFVQEEKDKAIHFTTNNNSIAFDIDTLKILEEFCQDKDIKEYIVTNIKLWLESTNATCDAFTNKQFAMSMWDGLNNKEIEEVHAVGAIISDWPETPISMEIYGEDNNPPQVHVISKDWDITFNIENGNINTIISKGKNIDVLDYAKENIKEWFDEKSCLNNNLTNQQTSLIVWNVLHNKYNTNKDDEIALLCSNEKYDILLYKKDYLPRIFHVITKDKQDYKFIFNGEPYKANPTENLTKEIKDWPKQTQSITDNTTITNNELLELIWNTFRD